MALNSLRSGLRLPSGYPLAVQSLMPADFSTDSAALMTRAHSCFVFGLDFLMVASLRLAVAAGAGFFMGSPREIDPACLLAPVDVPWLRHWCPSEGRAKPWHPIAGWVG